jgi:spore maturation protein CgeB
MRVLAPLLRYDYGIITRGESIEKSMFVPAMSANVEVVPLWLEDNGFPNDLRGLQDKIYRTAERIDPNLIFFTLMKDEIWIDTLVRLKKRWATANWFADDQWRFDSFTKRMAPLFTFPITVDKFSLSRYKAIGCNSVIYSQWGCKNVSRISEHDMEPIEQDVCFIGARNGVREWYIQHLERAGISVACFGSGWPNGRVSMAEMERITRRSKIALNLSNSQPESKYYERHTISNALKTVIGLTSYSNEYSHSLRRALSNVHALVRSHKRVEQIKARNFEIPAWGGFELSHYAIGIDDYFIPGKEIAFFASPSDLILLTRYYLENDSERESIRFAGNLRAQEHTYESRFRMLFERIKNDKSMYCRP